MAVVTMMLMMLLEPLSQQQLIKLASLKWIMMALSSG